MVIKKELIFKMMLSPERPQMNFSVPPRFPDKKFQNFDHSITKCSYSEYCPNNNTGFCGFCQYHCLKFHATVHAKNNKVD